MCLLAYRSVPLSVPCIFWKFEVRERLGLKIKVRELRSLAPYDTNHCCYTLIHFTLSGTSDPLFISAGAHICDHFAIVIFDLPHM